MSDAPGSVGTVQAHSGHRTGGRSLPSLLLGIFILWELLYLPAANVIKLLPVRLAAHKGELDDEVQLPADESAHGPAQAVRDGLAFGLSRWGELTGQTQGWALFAPTFGHQASLPVVAIQQPGALLPVRVQLQSPFKPVDPHVYFRSLWPSCRLFNYEYRLALLFWRWDNEKMSNGSYFSEHREEWRQAAFQRVRWQNRSMQAYMRWRVDKYLRENPQAIAPATVALGVETIPSPPPDSPFAFRRDGPWFWLALWSPKAAVPPGNLPVQAIDLWSQPMRWVWLPEED
jgi:hypothetical protein